MFLSTLDLSISRSTDGGRAFSTLEIWFCVFRSRVFSVRNSSPVIGRQLPPPANESIRQHARVFDETPL